ncbi:hypothetical protein PT285_06000 [Lactobacillus sp. ESL0791]|uniref:hypothetical protein n=1 Tax=Lactobacillus sp. ESL0791 TaxID=2983234 RepID=UPI0023F8F7A3|nr:hypothetical protein [Lactobacillus sp. ESL0791]MDF7638951.1 hypothetical protein [Lactobacillus sp. ESL0791]
MTTFGKTFVEFFKQKSRVTHQVILIQIIVSFIFALFMVFSHGGVFINKDVQMFGLPIDFYTSFLATSFITAFIYLLITCAKNENVNRSQTWRLIPLADGNIYLCNTLSSFLSLIYLNLLQAIFVGILTGWVSATNQDFRKSINSSINDIMQAVTEHSDFVTAHLTEALELIILMLLVGLAIYISVSFLNFSSRSLVDFLPSISSKFLVNLIRIILIIAICWLVNRIMGILNPILRMPFDFVTGSGDYGRISTVLLIVLAYDLVIGAINMFLISHSFEAEPNK